MINKINKLNNDINKELTIPILIQLYLKDVLNEIEIKTYHNGERQPEKDIFKYEIRTSNLKDYEILENIEIVETALFNRRKELKNEI